jgi:hypothetical protein
MAFAVGRSRADNMTYHQTASTPALQGSDSSKYIKITSCFMARILVIPF